MFCRLVRSELADFNSTKTENSDSISFLTSSRLARAEVTSSSHLNGLTENQEAELVLHKRKLRASYRPLTSPTVANRSRERLKLALSARAQEKDKVSRKHAHLQSASASHIQSAPTSTLLKRAQTIHSRPLTTTTVSRRAHVTRSSSSARAADPASPHLTTEPHVNLRTPQLMEPRERNTDATTALRVRSAALKRGVSVSASGSSRENIANRLKSRSSVFS